MGLGRKRQTMIKAKAALWVITVYNVVTCTLRHNISFWKILNISISRQSKAECGRTELRRQCHIELFVPSSTGGTVPVLFHMKYFMYLLILSNRIISQNASYPWLADCLTADGTRDFSNSMRDLPLLFYVLNPRTGNFAPDSLTRGSGGDPDPIIGLALAMSESSATSQIVL